MSGRHQSSAVYKCCVECTRRVGRALENARATRVTRDGPHIYERAVPHSRSRRVVRVVMCWVRASELYAWLSERPNLSMVDIDVQDSTVLGPVLAGLSRLCHEMFPFRVETISVSEDGVPASMVRFLCVLLVTAVLVSTATAVFTGGVGTRGLVVRVWFLVVGLVMFRVGQRLS